MEIAFISPVDDLGYDFTNYHMALTHLVLKYPDYADHYKELGKSSFVILDNSLIELGEAASLEKVLEAAAIINPSEIVLTDVYKKGDATINSVDNDLIVLKRNPEKYRFQLQAVCHGENAIEWQRCFHILEEMREIDCIGIPKVTNTIFKNGRAAAVKYAMENRINDTEIHLLGMWDSADEFRYYTNKEKDFIRGVDSSIVPHCTIESQSFTKNEFFKPDWKINLEAQYKMDVNLLKENQAKFMEFI